MNITEQHRKNAVAARSGKKSCQKRAYKPKAVQFSIFQDESGEWMLRFAGSDNAFPATDVEVVLWKRVVELEQKLQSWL